jgi:hypothetical protein
MDCIDFTAKIMLQEDKNEKPNLISNQILCQQALFFE